MNKLLTLIGRIFLSAIFAMAAIGKLSDFEGTVSYMQSAGITTATTFLLVGAIVLLLFGSISILIGWKAKWGALALIIFLIPTTLIFHSDFSNQMEQGLFLKNVAIIGGLLMVYVNGSGPLSVSH